MVNAIPPDHVDDLHEVEPNQPDLALAIPEPALVDENEEPEEEEEFEEEEPQEEEKDMEADPLNPSPPASDSEPEDVVEVEDTVEPEDETVPNSVHEVGESSTATFLREDGDSLFPSFMRRDINSLFGWIASLSRRLVCHCETSGALHCVGEREAILEDIIKDFGNAEESVECKKLKKELEDARSSNTLLRMQKERVERDLYWTRVQAHEVYQEMIRRGVVFEERPNEAINVLVKDEESFLLCRDRIMPPKLRPLTQAAIERMITQRVNEALTADRA
ncbi:hypothetical protein Tco_1453270, partial [Tanacetum coccineum]